MEHSVRTHYSLPVSAGLICAIILLWYVLAFAQCMLNDLNCMNLP